MSSYDYGYNSVTKQGLFFLYLSFYSGLGGGSNNFSTMFCNVDGALNSLSTLKDGSQVVVAGRNGMLQFI